MRLTKSILLTAMLTGIIWGQTSVTVSNFAELQAAVAEGGAKIVVAAGSFDVTVSMVIPAGADITVRSDGSQRALTLAGGVGGSVFTVSGGASLTLENDVTLAGRSGNIAPVVTVGGKGTFSMYGGVITGNSSGSTDGAARCGGVGVADSGTFNMYGGAVTGNSYTGSGGFGTGAGGVMVGRGAVFNMYGGEVSNNTNSYMSSSSSSSSNGAGGVYVSDGTFNMYDGAVISGNRQTGNFNFAAAGGVYLANVSTFNMYGGTITGNGAVSTPSGGGIYNSATSTIEFSGSPRIEDGVYLHSTASSPSFAARLHIGGAGLTGSALIVIQGCTQQSQMDAGTNLTSPFTGLTADMAKAFVSADKKLVGKVGGTAANPRIVWADNYELSIAPAADKVFDPAAYGYGGLTPYTVTINNIGLGQTNELTISLSGIGAGAFTLSKENIANIAAGASGNFTVMPKTGLGAGTYNAVVTVAGEYDMAVSFNVTFTVTRADAAGTVSMDNWTYGGVPKDPIVAGMPSDYTGTVTYTYKTQNASDDTYSTTKPTGAGGYTVRAVFLSTHNYNEHIATADFTISKAALTVTAADRIVFYDYEPPVYGAVYSGFVNNDNVTALSGTLTFECNYVKGDAAGTTHPVTPGGLTSSNYELVYKSGTLTVVQNTDDSFGSVSVTGWTYGGYNATLNAPVVSSTNGTAGVIFRYKRKDADNAAYITAWPPENAGEYTVKAVFPETANFDACSATVDFTISKARLIIMAAGANITYGDPAPDHYSFAAKGFVNGDNINYLSGKLAYVCDYAQGMDAGDYLIRPSGVSSNNYNIEFWDGALTVERYVTAISASVSGKVYDGGTAATVIGTPAVRWYGISGDDIFVVPGTAAFSDKNAGANKTVKFSGWSLGGAKAHNYIWGQPKNAAASITPKPIAVRPGDIAYGGKVYDGTTAVRAEDVTITLSDSSGIIGSDAVTAGFASAVFDGKDAGERIVTVSGITLHGADAGNYALINAAAVKTTEIRKHGLIVKADNKLIHPDADLMDPATLSFTYSMAGSVDGEELFTSDNPLGFSVGPDIDLGHEFWPAGTMTLLSGVYPVTPQGETGNYIVTPVPGLLTISDKNNVSAGIALADSIAEYDGTPKAAAAVYNNSGANFTYAYSGISDSGGVYNSPLPPTDAGSYIVEAIYEDADNIGKASAKLTVTPKPVTIAVSVSGKEYDGTAAAAVTAYDVAGLINGDAIDVIVVPGTASFVDRNAGTDKAVTFSGWGLGGAKAHNYVLTEQPADTTADIFPKTITVSPNDVDYGGKVYDGTAAAVGLAMMIPLSAVSGIVPGDAAAVSANTAQSIFDDPNAGSRAVTIPGLTLRGDNAGNYVLSSDTVVKSGVEITKRGAIIKAKDQLVIIPGGSLSAFEYALLGIVEGETGVITDGPDFGVGQDITLGHEFWPLGGSLIAGVYPVTPVGAAAANYKFTYIGGFLTISDKTDVSGDIVFGNDVVSSNKTVEYDGGPQPVTAVYNDSDAGFTYWYTGTAVSGAEYGPSAVPPTDAGTYFVTVTYEDETRIGKKSITLTISPKPVTVLSASHTKEYDGTRNAFGIGVYLDGVVDGDDVSIASASAMYTSQHAGTKTVNISSVTLAGTKSDNYSVTGLPKVVTVDGGITSKMISAYVRMDSWTYGGEAASPSVNGIPADYAGTITLTYKTRGAGDDKYQNAVPINAGDYIVRASFSATDDYAEYTTSSDFTVAKASQGLPYIPGLANTKSPLGVPASVPELGADVPRVPFDLSGLQMVIADSSVTIIPRVSADPNTAGPPDVANMANWEYSISGGGWTNTPMFERLTPNTQYIILVRMRGTDNYHPSGTVAVLSKTTAIGAVPVNDEAAPAAAAPPPPIFIDVPASDKRSGIMLAKTLVRDKAEFSVSTPDKMTLNIAIYDRLGNIVFKKSGVKTDENIVWDLKNISGRGVAGGSYLITATARDKNGKPHRYTSKIGVTR